jgi:hypothetical protein
MNIAQYMADNSIHAIKAWPVGRVSVELTDGRFGIGVTVSGALEEAKQPDAQNIRKAA